MKGKMASMSPDLAEVLEQDRVRDSMSPPLSASQLHDEAILDFQQYQNNLEISYLTRSIEKLQQALELARNGSGGNNAGRSVVAITHDLVAMVGNRYKHTRNESDLELGISEGSRVIEGLQADDPMRVKLSDTLGHLHGLRYGKTGNREDLDRAISHTRLAILNSPENSLNNLDTCLNLGGWLLDRYYTNTALNLEDLGNAIESVHVATTVIQRHEPNNPRKAMAFSMLAMALYARFEHSEDLDTINQAIQAMKEALHNTPRTHPDRTQRQSILILLLSHKFVSSGGFEELKDAISSMAESQALMESTGSDPVYRALHQLELWVLPRYLKSDATSIELDRFLQLAQEAVNEYPEQPNVLYYLGSQLLLRSDRIESKDDVDRALETLKLALQKTCQNSSLRERVISALTQTLSRRFHYQKHLADVEEAIVLGKQVLELPAIHPVIQMRIKTILSDNLFSHFKESDDKNSLEESIGLLEQVLESAPSVDRPSQLRSYGEILISRYEVYGDPVDVTRSIASLEEAMSLVSEDDHRRPLIAGALGSSLRRRFDQTNRIEDLNLGIQITAWAMKNGPALLQFQKKMAINLSTYLNLRHFRTDALEDLSQAITSMESVLDAGHLSGSDLAACLSHLAGSYINRFNRFKLRDDADMAVDLLRRAIKETLPTHSDYVRMVATLGRLLMARSLLDGYDTKRNDMDESIECLGRYLAEMPADDPQRVQIIVDLGNTLRRRFALSQNISDINSAIELLSDTSIHLKNDHILRADVFFALGNALEAHYQHTKHQTQGDREQTIAAFSESFNSLNGRPITRIAGAELGATILESLGRWKESLDLLRGALNMFLVVTPRLLSRLDQQHVLSHLGGISSRAAAVALNVGVEPYEALKLLEIGRGVIASFSLGRRMDVSMLGPEMASKYRTAQEKLEMTQIPRPDHLDDTLSDWVKKYQNRFDAEKDLREIIDDIRSHPETKSFLDAPTLEEIIKVIHDDIVVVLNESQSGCDAFLIDKVSGIRIVPLSKLRQPDIKSWRDKLRAERPRINALMLEWLWNVVAEPVFTALGIEYKSSPTSLPKVWWVMAGMMSYLPIHAAGVHSCRAKTVLGRVVSVYAASLRALVFSRTHRSPESDLLNHHKAVLVGMPESPGQKDLPFAKEEIQRLRGITPKLGLEPIELTCPNKKEVLAQLADCSLFHFAGHGLSHSTDPSASGLLVKDGLLTVADLQDNSSQRGTPFLGFLSACLTGANDMDQLVDEGIHLISAFQLSGFRHIIGTFWQVSDKTCVAVAEKVYEAIAESSNKDDAVSLGLHEAIVSLRDKWAEQHFPPPKEHTTGEVSMGVQSTDPREPTLKLKRSHPKAPLIEANWIPYVCYSG
ncbi:CHAT domain-containing protein [Camillea tinctor]|nr:CHAT domain-containing protein [Camillea tinctor]